MADKGFEIKVLIPTDDGLTISENSFEAALYYLMYNVSNRSYQLAGKIKTRELRDSNILDKVNQLVNREKVDFIISNSAILGINCKHIKVELSEINQILNNLIDKIDQKKELI